MQFPYIPEAGTLYARSFALIDSLPPEWRLFYYEPDDDCTNFISQCVWAAYGGWVPGFQSEIRAQNQKRILADVRQVKGVWYGSARHIGSLSWCRVVEFYEFATDRTKSTGPLAHKAAEGTFDTVDPALIRQGDVLQLVVAPYAPYRYGHGLYVTRPGRSWGEITVCSHTINRLDEPMTAFSAYPQVYKKLRVLRFGPAGFAG